MKKILIFIIFCCILSGIAGCGQTGALYLPSEKEHRTTNATK